MKKETWKWLNDNKDIYPFEDVLSYIFKLETQVENIKEYINSGEFLDWNLGFKLIDLMAEQLSGLAIFDMEKDEPIILLDEEVKEYFYKKAEKEDE